MVIPAHFSELPAGGSNPRAPRRRLLLQTSGALASGDAASVTIHNVSAGGLLLETETALSEGERIEVELPELGLTPAMIVWSSGTFHGASFAAPLSTGVLSALELRSRAPASPSAAGEAFGARIHELRKSRGMTLDAVASALGVSKPTVWAWEQGRARPAPERLAGIAALFGLQEADLASGRDHHQLSGVLAQARQQVAAAYNVDAARVRILIEL